MNDTTTPGSAGTQSPAARMLHKLGLTVMAGTLALSLAGCNIGEQLVGQYAQDPALRGSTAIMQVYEGGPLEPVTFLNGSALVAGAAYGSNGSVHIEGDVPAGVTIDVGGRLIVEGNVGPGANFTANLPIGRVGIAYPGDTRPGITVTGSVGAGSIITTNGGIAVGAAAADVKLYPGQDDKAVVGDEPAEPQVARLPVPSTHAPGL